MPYNPAEIAFYAVTLHIADPQNNLLEECVDNLATRAKMPLDTYDLLEEFAEQLYDLLLDQPDLSCMKMFGHILNPQEPSETMGALRYRRDEFSGSMQSLLDEICFEEGNDEDDEEANNLRDQIDMADNILKNIMSNMSDKETDQLLNAALEVDDIRKSEPLHLYMARMNAHPSLASE